MLLDNSSSSGLHSSPPVCSGALALAQATCRATIRSSFEEETKL
jgi:hypothetical protein